MYTLLVSGAASEQDRGVFSMPTSRFLEYTDEAIAIQLSSLSAEAAECLKSWPCFLLEEGRADEPVRIGRITAASVSRGEIHLAFEPVDGGSVLTNDDLWKLSADLDIGDWEFHRNHIAVKDRDAIRTLAASGYPVGRIQHAFVDQRLPAPDRPTLLRARAVIGEWGHTQIDDLLLEIGVPTLKAPKGLDSRRDRANKILQFVLDNPTATTDEQYLLSAYIVRRALGATAQEEGVETPTASGPVNPSTPPSLQREPRAQPRSPNRVFVVHGNNHQARTAVVGHLRDLGLEPIVLHEQPSMGRHLLTKFIQEAELATFAVVVMTDDDEGCIRQGTTRPRARQNVILELGYFLARLGQPRVCALITPGLETPSDFDGIVYIKMDIDGNWCRELTRELVAAEMPVVSNAPAPTA